MKIPTPDQQQEIDEIAAKYGLKQIPLPAELLGTCILSGDCCPECGSALRTESGCAVCPACGFSRCG